MNIYEETAKHFDVEELKRDAESEKIRESKDIKEEEYLSRFKSYFANGRRVIDLTSIDEDYTEYETFNRSTDIERQQIYGEKASSNRF